MAEIISPPFKDNPLKNSFNSMFVNIAISPVCGLMVMYGDCPFRKIPPGTLVTDFATPTFARKVSYGIGVGPATCVLRNSPTSG